MNILARAFSIIFHPVIMPLTGTVVIFYSGTTLSIMDKNVMRLVYIFIAFSTFILPISLLPLFFQLKVVKNIEMNRSRERVIPYFITFLLYYGAHLLINRLNINYYFSLYLFSAAILVLVLTIISYFWKISTHMAGIGGLTGLVLSLSYEFHADLMLFLVFFLFISGILGSSRLKLQSHSSAQVYTGFFTGIIVVFGIIHLFYSYQL